MVKYFSYCRLSLSLIYICKLGLKSPLRALIKTITIIIHQTHYEKSDWSRAFNQFTIACELDMINVLSAADITCQVHRLPGY